MSRGTTLSFLIELRRRERDRVATEAANARREADKAGTTLEMLRGYRSDYEGNSPKRGDARSDATSIRLHEAFVARLDDAIGEQHSLVGRLEEVTTRRASALTEREQRLRALEALAERRAEAARKLQKRAEQKATDEFATQAFVRAQRRARKP